jgi:NitT/TauT family transport system substrate-binding protein
MVAYLQGVRSYNDAIVYGNTDRDKVIDILTKTTFVDNANLFLKMKPPGLDPNGKVLIEGIKADQDWYSKKGLVKNKININDIIDTSYSDNALKILGQYQAPK